MYRVIYFLTTFNFISLNAARWESCSVSAHLFAKSVNLALALQLTRLPSQSGCQVLLASTSSNVLRGRGSAKTFNKCLGVSTAFPSAVESNHKPFEQQMNYFSPTQLKWALQESYIAPGFWVSSKLADMSLPVNLGGIFRAKCMHPVSFLPHA